jgi:hypothetical protein
MIYAELKDLCEEKNIPFPTFKPDYPNDATVNLIALTNNIKEAIVKFLLTL